MRALYAEAKKGKHFKDEELIGKIEKISGTNLQDFYRKYIAGMDSLELAPYLNKMGLLKDYKEETHTGVSFRTRFLKDSVHLVIDTFINTHTMMMVRNQGEHHDSTITKETNQKSDLELAGLMKGDTILSINGKVMNKDDADEFSLNHTAPTTIELEIARNGERLKKTVTLKQPRNSSSHSRNIAPNKDATAAELAIRKAIYGG
jgi:predicted metalloprotease with PDZ domain